MTHLLLFGEFIDSNNLSILLQQKLNILTPLNGLGTYLQGISQQNTVDFIWGTDSGTRGLLIALFLNTLKLVFGSNWEKTYEVFTIILPCFGFLLAMRLIKKTNVLTIIGSLLYTFNPWILNRMLSGFWQLNIVYAILPFIITIPLRYTIHQKFSAKKLFFWSSTYAIFASIIFTSQ